IIDVTPEKRPAPPFEIAVQPKSATGTIVGGGKSIQAVLGSVIPKTAEFIGRYLAFDHKAENRVALSVEIKNILENYRSILEYSAHHLAAACKPVPDVRKVQFPIATKNDDKAKFLKKLNEWFPGVASTHPAIIDLLTSIQHLSGYPWLLDF